MATRRIFWGFCINRFGIGPLHYISSRSDFSFEFAEIFVIEKRLPDSPSQGVDKNAYRYNFCKNPRKSASLPCPFNLCAGCTGRQYWSQVVPQCLSGRPNWDPPTTSATCECAPPPKKNQRGGHTRRRTRGWGSPILDDWRKNLAHCLISYKELKHF